jgi:hypothetical protein
MAFQQRLRMFSIVGVTIVEGEHNRVGRDGSTAQVFSEFAEG